MSTARYEYGEFRKHGARGVPGSEALAAELDRIVRESGIKSPVTTDRGVGARIKYLNTEEGRSALAAAGIKPRTFERWTKGKARPSVRSREKLDRAYWNHRRHNMIKSGALTKRLNQGGNGTRIEIYPVDQNRVQENYYRANVQQRSITVRDVWSDVVSASEAGDMDALDEIWTDIIKDLGSDYIAYAYVQGLGLGA